jgi:hypothetical protein
VRVASGRPMTDVAEDMVEDGVEFKLFTGSPKRVG